MGKYAISYDIGTTGVKTCVFEITDTIKLLAGESKGYKFILASALVESVIGVCVVPSSNVIVISP